MSLEQAAAVRGAVQDEVDKGEDFSNVHGITGDNLESFLVEPFEILIDPDDLETAVRPMWVVLQEHGDPSCGHVIVYDPSAPGSRCGVAVNARRDEYVLVVGANSLAEALNGM